MILGLSNCTNCQSQSQLFSNQNSRSFQTFTPPDILVVSSPVPHALQNDIDRTSYVGGLIASDSISLVKGSQDYVINGFKFVGYTYQTGYVRARLTMGVDRDRGRHRLVAAVRVDREEYWTAADARAARCQRGHLHPLRPQPREERHRLYGHRYL